jgi:hypothetical protein
VNRTARIALIVGCALAMLAFGLGMASVWTFGPARTPLGQSAALLIAPAFVAFLVALIASDESGDRR